MLFVLLHCSDFDKDHVQPEVVNKVRIYTAMQDFTPEAVEKVCCWVDVLVRDMFNM